MSVARHIDDALRRGFSPVSVARTFGVGVKHVETRAVVVAEEMKMRADLRRRKSEEARERRLRGLAETEDMSGLIQKWCEFPIRYEDDPRSRPWDGTQAVLNTMRLKRSRPQSASYAGISGVYESQGMDFHAGSKAA